MSCGATPRMQTRSLIGGDRTTKSFSVWWMKVGKVVAAFVMNRPDEEREIAPKLIETQKAVDSGQLANDVIPLGELMSLQT
jgi:hypothetical protein